MRHIITYFQYYTILLSNQIATFKYHLIIFALTLAIIGVLFNIRSSAQLLLGQLLSGGQPRRYFNVKPLSDSIINVIYIPIIYAVALMFIKKIVALYPTLDWLSSLLTITLIAFILIFLVPLYQDLRAYLETSTGRSVRKVAANQENASFIICPNCGYKNPIGSKFCVRCGTKLPEASVEETEEEEVEIPTTKEQGLICPNCRYKNSIGSKFCVRCGTPLISPKDKDSEQE